MIRDCYPEASPSAGWRTVYQLMHVPQPDGGAR